MSLEIKKKKNKEGDFEKTNLGYQQAHVMGGFPRYTIASFLFSSSRCPRYRNIHPHAIDTSDLDDLS